MVLPVKVSIGGSTHLAHTFDLTYVGARLGGLHVELKSGEIISLQRGAKKANFRVMWVNEIAPHELQAGVQALEQQNNFWGIDLSEQEREGKGSGVDALMSLMAPKEKA